MRKWHRWISIVAALFLLSVAITGVVLQGDAPKAMLVRAVGPALGAFGVAGALANPHLRLFRGTELIGENDDWGQGAGSDASAIAAAAAKTGAFALPAGSRDAAILLTLPAGAYSAHVSGANNTTGIALVEIYEVP